MKLKVLPKIQSIKIDKNINIAKAIEKNKFLSRI